MPKNVTPNAFSFHHIQSELEELYKQFITIETLYKEGGQIDTSG